MSQILADLAYDCSAVLLNKPGVGVAGATVTHIGGQHCFAVVRFSDDSTLEHGFELPASDIHPALVNTLQSLLLEACRKIEAAITRDMPAWGHAVH